MSLRTTNLSLGKFILFRILVIAILACHSLVSLAQVTDTDRIEKILDSLEFYADTARGASKIPILKEYLSFLIQSGYSGGGNRVEDLLLEIRKLALQHNSKSDLAWVFITQANIYLSGGRIEKSRAEIEKCKPYLDLEAGKDFYILGAYYQLLGRIQASLGHYDSALVNTHKAINYLEKLGRMASVANTYNYLAEVYNFMGDARGEINALKNAYQYALNSQNIDYSHGVAAISFKMGYRYMTSGRYEEALKYFKTSDSIFSNMDIFLRKHYIYHAKQAANIARVYQLWGQLDSAMKYRKLALRRFEEYGIGEKNINVPNQYCYIGTIFREIGNFDSANYYFERSLLLRKQNKDSLGVGMCLDEMAVMAKIHGHYDEAIQMLNEAMSWKQGSKNLRIDPSRIAQRIESLSESYLLIGQVFEDWSKFNDALHYYDSAFILSRSINFKRGHLLSYYHKGIVWENMGAWDSAYYYLDHSMNMAVEMENRPLIALVSKGLGNLSLEQGELFSAMDYFEDAIRIYEQDGFVRELPELFLALGMALADFGNDSSALPMLKKAYDVAEYLDLMKIQAEAGKAISGLYEKQGNYRIANQYLRRYILLYDSVFTLQSHKQLAELQALHESQQQQQQIFQLEQESEINSLKVEQSRYIIFSLGGILIIILLFGLLFVRQVQIRNQQKALINQQRLFRSQMNPHFIFNSLTNIQHYIFNKDSLAAGKYLAIFAKLMRSILNNSRKEIITLREEIDTIRQYLDLQKLRMDDKLDYEIIVDEKLDVEITEIPPMLAQPFIENAIEHGIRHKEGKGKVNIRIALNGSTITYEVEDNGVGREKARELSAKKNKNHVSMAVSLTRSRLHSLWGRKKPDHYFDVIDKEDDNGTPTGTIVRFKIPS